MDASKHDIEDLKRLQDIDRDLNRLNKQLEELPQRQIILDARQKRGSLSAKLSQIESLSKETSKKLTRLTDEDASLAKKEKGVQAAIEAAGGDFRGVEARTKELDGIFKRRGTLADEIANVKAELAKIEGLRAQVDEAIETTDGQEAAATESFKAEGGSLKANIMKLQQEREVIVTTLSPEIADAYKRTSAHVGSVTIGTLEGNRCMVCRATIESGHLIALRNEAPLGVCPSCGRLLIIEE